MKKLLLLPTLLLAIPTLHAMDGATSSSSSSSSSSADLQKKDGWNADEYFKHSNPQFKSAMSIITPMPAPWQPEDWLDLGCGPGRVSAELAKKNVLGTVVGVDASESQIALARQLWQQHKNLTFQVVDAQNLQDKERFQLILSFAAIHWMQEKQDVFNGCYNALKWGGKLVLTMRAKEETVLKQAFLKTAQEPEWAMLQKINPDQQDYPVEKDELDTYLKQSGFRNIEIIERYFGDRFTPEEFKGFIGSLIGAFGSFKQLKAQKPELVNKLVDALVKNYIAISPLGDDGKLEYKLKGWGATAYKFPYDVVALF